MTIPGVIGTLAALITQNDKAGFFFAKHVFSPLVFPICLTRISVHGKENVDWKKTHLFIANHESLLDIPAVTLGAKKNLYYLVKHELKNVPFVGWLASALGMIFVDRKDSEKGRESIRKAGEIIKGGKNVISFAEGTRTKDGKMGRFKKGSFRIALENEIDIIPIRITGARQILPSGSFKLRPGHIHVYFGKEIKVNKFKDQHPEELANYTREVVMSMA